MSAADWIVLGMAIVACILALAAQKRRIKREHAEFLAEWDRELTEARADAIQNCRPIIPQPKPERRGRN